MLSKPFVRVATLVAAGLLACVAGFLIFHQPIQQEVATTSAERAFGAHKLNLLVLGYQDDEQNTDTIILAHLDVDRRSATLVSIPRDTWVAIPHHGHQKINAAFAYGGAKTTAAVVAQLMGGVHIDATLALQPDGAGRIVDAMGGLDVNVDETMNYDDNNGALHIHLKKGEQHLSGRQVVGYVRFRHDAKSDFGRVARQRQVLKAMMNQLSAPQNWAKLPRLLDLAHRDVQTALTNAQLAALLEIYRNVPDDNIRDFTVPSRAGWVGDASVVFADARWSKWIGSVLFSNAEPPQDEVLVANATGNADVDKTIIGALRGAGWNVPTFVDQPQRRTSRVIGESDAARALAKAFAITLASGKKTTFILGSDLAPATD